MKPKTILLPIYNGIRARNFFHTDTYKELIGDARVRLVIVIPPSKLDFYRSEYSEKNVTFEPLEVLGEPRVGRILSVIAFNLLNTKTVRFKQKLAYWKGGSYFNFLFLRTLNLIFSRFRFVRTFLRFLDRFVPADGRILTLLEKYSPDVFLAPDIVFPIDRVFLRAARKKEIYTIGMTRSWDNLTSKGVVQILPQKLILHTTRMKRQAVDLVGMPEKDIEVTGPPDYDKYFSIPSITKEKFLKQIGVDPTYQLKFNIFIFI